MADLILWNTLNYGSPSLLRPVGPHQLAQWLIKHGYTVKVIDFCSVLTTNDLVEITKKFVDNNTIAIGVSSTFWHPRALANEENSYTVRNPQGNTTSEEAEPSWVLDSRVLLEGMYPKLDWVLGGALSESLLQLDWTKFHGHAEDATLKYLNEKRGKTALISNFEIQKLENGYGDELCIQPHEVLGIELGRGCQFKCGFCRYPLLGKKKNTYLRDFDLVRLELLQNYYNFGITRYTVLDDTTNESLEKIEMLANVAQALPFKLEWVGFGRVDLIWSRRQTIQLLKDSGLRSMFFGIESFHPEACKSIGKGWSSKHGKDFLVELKDTWGKDINFHTGFIIGLPGESELDIDNSVRWCIDNNMSSVYFAPLNISSRPDLLFKSEFDTNYEKYGYRFNDPSNESYWENDNWSAASAHNKAAEIHSYFKKNNRIAAFGLADVANLGYSIDELIDVPCTMGPKERLYKLHLAVKQYVHFQKNISSIF
jgi:hypothetical protein